MSAIVRIGRLALAKYSEKTDRGDPANAINKTNAAGFNTIASLLETIGARAENHRSNNCIDDQTEALLDNVDSLINDKLHVERQHNRNMKNTERHSNQETL